MTIAKRFTRNIRLAAILAAGVITLGASALPASAGVKVGVLQCQVGVGVGLIVMEKEKLLCTFHSNTGATEHYHGLIRKFGLGISAMDLESR